MYWNGEGEDWEGSYLIFLTEARKKIPLVMVSVPFMAWRLTTAFFTAANGLSCWIFCCNQIPMFMQHITVFLLFLICVVSTQYWSLTPISALIYYCTVDAAYIFGFLDERQTIMVHPVGSWSRTRSQFTHENGWTIWTSIVTLDWYYNINRTCWIHICVTMLLDIYLHAYICVNGERDDIYKHLGSRMDDGCRLLVKKTSFLL
jgi:hypothetical protein